MRTAIALASAALLFSSAAGARPSDRADDTANESHMSVTHAPDRGGAIGTPDTFTGTVYVEPVFDNRDPLVVNGGKVTFLPKARSHWHSHPAGQVLIVTEGMGWVQERGGKRIAMRPGDVIWTPPGVEHWHGASDSHAVTHYAIQQFEDGKNVVWLEPVSDAQYLGE